MAYPTKPDGCLRTTNFGVDVADGSWSGTKPECWYMYAIVPYITAPVAWGGSEFGSPLTMSVSRAVAVDSGSYYDDSISWISPAGNESFIVSTESEADITNTVEWTERQYQGSDTPVLVEPWPAPGCPFGILEIKSWDDTEESLGSMIIALSVEFSHVDDYDEQATSDVRQHIERVPLEIYEPGYFASAYLAQWGICESINRSIYEDRHSNTWPVARYAIIT